MTSDTMFVTVGEDVEFRWVDSVKAYEIQLPGQASQRLTMLDSTANYENHYPSPSQYFIHVRKGLPYQYTNLATHHENGWGTILGEFAYGIPTAPGDIPITGSASYTAEISGQLSYQISGDAKLMFDFGAGTLAGYMHPILSDAWFSYDFGQYDFTQTVYSPGSTTFSGKFVVPGGGSTAGSGFNGVFTGPDAAELMAEWHAPFPDPNNNNQWATMSGLWIGKKD